MINIAFDKYGNRYEAKTTSDWANADLVISVKDGIASVEKYRLGLAEFVRLSNHIQED